MKIEIAKVNIEDFKYEKINVAAYIRVSKKNKRQTKSLDLQKKFFKNFILRNKNWNFAGIYIDTDKSDMTIKNNTNFENMINDSLNKNIKLILTKSFSSFGRNIVETLKYIRLLTKKNIGIYFMEENIFTLDMSEERLLAIISAIYLGKNKRISIDITLDKVQILMREKATNNLVTSKIEKDLVGIDNGN